MTLAKGGINMMEQDILLVDRMNDLAAHDPLYSFALDELLCRRTGRGGPAVCHIWRHPQAFILGAQDARLPYAREAMDWLESGGWPVVVRNSGGAAVPLDGGVVNLSLILPNASLQHASYRSDFERMSALIASALQYTGRKVEKGLIKGAYCPGDYDLSIEGVKFCGIAQRRQAKATVIQAFVVAEGSGGERAGFVRSFYDMASGGDDSLGHPLVVPGSTGSLEELAGLGPMAGFVFAEAVRSALASRLLLPGSTAWTEQSPLPEQDEIAAAVDMLRARYGAEE